MESQLRKRNTSRKRRIMRVRRRLRGDMQRPRLCVVKTNCHLHAQLIDDENGVTLASGSTHKSKKTTASAKELGKDLAKKAKSLKIKSVLFDRGKSKYHGVLAALADGAREEGLEL